MTMLLPNNFKADLAGDLKSYNNETGREYF